MAFENSYLRLNSTLNCDPNPNHHNTQQNKKYLSSRLKFDNVLPTLSLGLPQEREEEKRKIYNPLQASNSPISGVSSYSDSSVKREREVVGEEEVEVERDDHDEGYGVRKKLRLTKQQSIILEDSFKEHSTLNHKQKQELAKQLNLRPRQVEVWFQNRRARTRLKQTELEYDIMKKFCETLAFENKRLHKEIQDLKTVMAKSSFYLQLPDATLTVCSSCERI